MFVGIVVFSLIKGDMKIGIIGIVCYVWVKNVYDLFVKNLCINRL